MLDPSSLGRCCCTSLALLLAGLEGIRGYGHVKERHLKAAREKEAGLPAALHTAHAGSREAV